MEFFSLHHLIQLLHAYGNVVLGVVVGLESLGLPLPGETLLIAAAVLAGTTHQMNIAVRRPRRPRSARLSARRPATRSAGASASACCDATDAHVGLTDRRLAFGRALFRRHGVKVVFASRFIVLLRTLAALLAGANRMPWGRFMVANVAGSVAWSALYGFGAYLLGHEAKHVAGPVAIGIGVIVAAALVAAGLYVRRREHSCWRSRCGPDVRRE